MFKRGGGSQRKGGGESTAVHSVVLIVRTEVFCSYSPRRFKYPLGRNKLPYENLRSRVHDGSSVMLVIYAEH